MDNLLEKLDRYIIFFIIYTFVFFTFFKTLPYTIPFVLAFLFALILQKPTKFLARKFSLKPYLASLITTLVFYIVFFTIIGLILTSLISELISLTSSITTFVSSKNINIQNTYDYINKFYNNLNPTITKAIESNWNNVTKYVANFGTLTISFLLNLVTNFVSSIPYWIMLFLFTVISTYFFSRDISEFRNSNKVSPLFDSKYSKFWDVLNEIKRTLGNYVKSYMIVISITFVVTLIGFIIFNVRYAFALSVLCGILDLLPVLGIPIVYFPLIGYYAADKNYFAAIGILVWYIIVFITRQIAEPKIVSSSLGLHPVAVLAAFFIGLKAAGFMGMIFCIFLVVFFNIFRKVKIL